MAEVENLEIVIGVIEQYEEELAKLLATLEVIERQAERVDDIDITVDVHDAQLNALAAKLAAMQAMEFGDIDVDVGARGGGPMSAGTAAAMDEAADNVNLFNLRMSDVHNALAKLIPFILVLIGAIPALIGALVAVAVAAVAAASALAAIAALGAAGFALAAEGGLQEGLMSILDRIQKDFMDAFRPLMEDLAPLFRDGLDGLNAFFEALEQRGHVLLNFADEARGFGRWLLDWLPNVIADMGRFAEAVAPAMAALADFFGQFDFFGGLASFLADVLPPLLMVLDAFMHMLPAIMQLSVGFLLVTGAALELINAISWLLSFLPITAEQLGAVTAGVLTLYTGVLLLNSAFLQAAYGALVQFGRTMLRLLSVIAGYIGMSGQAIAATFGLAASFTALAAAIALTGLGAIAVIFGSIANTAAMASTNIDEATRSLKAFRRQQERMVGGRNPYADPQLGVGEGTGRSRFAGRSVNITVQGDADDETVKQQTHNALYRLERPVRR